MHYRKHFLLAATFLSGAALPVVAIASDTSAAESAGGALQVASVSSAASQVVKINNTATGGVNVFDALNIVDVETYINKLPQFTPNFSANSISGEAFANMRGLGPERTLTLFNGRRFVSNASLGRRASSDILPMRDQGVVDLNVIPAALLDRIEIAPGGGAAVYGSGAVAGVVNFLVDDEFSGVALDSSYEIDDHGDGDLFNVALTAGAGFADGRGNAVLSVGYTKRNGVLLGERDNVVDALFGPDGPEGSLAVPSTLVFDFNPDFTAAGVDAPPCNLSGSVDAGGFCTSDNLGWFFNPTGAGVTPFVNGGADSTRFDATPFRTLQLPQERLNIYASGSFEVSPSVEAYAQAIYSTRDTEYQQAPAAVAMTATINLDNPFLAGDPQALALLSAISGGADSDGNGVMDAVVLTSRRLLEAGVLRDDNRNEAFQFQGGLRGDLGGDWNWDLFGSLGQSETTTTQQGAVSMSAYLDAIRENRANVFDANGLSPAVASEISRMIEYNATNELLVVSGVLKNNDLIDMPWSSRGVATAIGVEYRREDLEGAAAGFSTDIVGVNPIEIVAGDFDVFEAFAEFSLPIIEDAAFAKSFDLTGAFRFSDYSTSGDALSWSAGAKWALTDGVALHGEYQRAHRAPSIREVFAARADVFPGAIDPCSMSFAGPVTPEIQENCVADGVPAASVGIISGPLPQLRAIIGGNPELREETADIYSAGVTFAPENLPGVSFGVEYFHIDLHDAVLAIGAQQIYDDCILAGSAAACDRTVRLPSGMIDFVDASLGNFGHAKTAGMDFRADYTTELSEQTGADLGTLDFSFAGTWVWKDERRRGVTSPVFDQQGTRDSAGWRHLASIAWNKGPVGAYLDWQYIGGTDVRFVGDRSNGASNLVGLALSYRVLENVRATVGARNLFDAGPKFFETNELTPVFDPLGRRIYGRLALTF